MTTMQTSPTFPQPGNSSFNPHDVLLSDLWIRLYLNAAAADPPTSGFGRVAPYLGDVVRLGWSADDDVSFHQSLFCMPCRQVNGNKRPDEEFDWTSCEYAEDKLPGLFSTGVATGSSASAEHSFTLEFPFDIKLQTGLCTFSIPSSDREVYNLTVPFPFIYTAPPADRGKHIFTSEAPEGIKLEGSAWTGIVSSMGLILGGLVCLTMLGCLYRRNKKRAEAARAQSMYLDDERMVQDAKGTGYTDSA